jgi:catechol 2,3-dioxygenase-like lactoylglutathione lyase family enzyme
MQRSRAEVLARIRDAIDVNLSLHGGSGTPGHYFEEAARIGVSKVNVNSDLRYAYRITLERQLCEHPDQYAIVKLIEPVIEAVQDVVASRIELFGARGKPRGHERDRGDHAAGRRRRSVVALLRRPARLRLDVDYAPSTAFRVVQLTPPGSGCSIQIGTGLTDARPGTARSTYLVVDDLAAEHARLEAAGVPLGPIRHKAPPGAWDGGFAPGLDRDRSDYASFADFADPDGNTWMLQERGHGRD